MAAALVAGALAWGGAQSETNAPIDPLDTVQPAVQPAVHPSNAPVPVALQATVRRPVKRQPVAADPDRIGPCPKRHSPVIWQGMEDGRPTWKHKDGSITQRAQQRVSTDAGEVLQVPVIVSMRPAEAAAAESAAASEPGTR